MAYLCAGHSAAVKVASFLGTFILLVSIGCHILCLATPFYFVLEDGKAKEVLTGFPDNFTFGINYGLWLICVDGGDEMSQDKCYHMVEKSILAGTNPVISPDWIVAPRVLAILGVVLATAGVVSLIAFVLTQLKKVRYLFLATAAVTSIIAGVVILSGDIAFAAEKTISFYADSPQDTYFIPTGTPQSKAYRVQQLDNRVIAGWSFILDLISGSLCIVSGPIFVFIALKIQRAREIEDAELFKEVSRLNHDNTKMTSL